MGKIQNEAAFSEAINQLKLGVSQGQDVTLSAVQARIVLEVIDHIQPDAAVKGVRLGDLLATAPTGLWEDVEDGLQFARKLRQRASRRQSLDEYLNG